MPKIVASKLISRKMIIYICIYIYIYIYIYILKYLLTYGFITNYTKVLSCVCIKVNHFHLLLMYLRIMRDQKTAQESGCERKKEREKEREREGEREKERE